MTLSMLVAAVALQGAAPASVPAALMAKLTRGVNVARWFCYCPPHDTERFKVYLVDQDFQNFKRLGVSFVRLCVEPEAIYNDGVPDAANLPLLDAAIDRLEAAGLAVILDLHDTHGKMKLDEPGRDNSAFVRFWGRMAQHYKGRQETSLVFELVNEPIFRNNPDDWYKLQSQTVNAVRAADARRTILAKATRFDGIDTLAKMNPLPQGNLIYSIHCYDPFIFTHQGATWSSEQYKVMRKLPFPSSPESVAPVLDEIPEQYRKEAVTYGDKRFDSAYLKSRLKKAADWGTKNAVPVLLGEFGCYPPMAPRDSRARWFEAMRDAIDKLGMPSCLWGYDDALGLGRNLSFGAVQLDPVTTRSYFRVDSARRRL